MDEGKKNTYYITGNAGTGKTVLALTILQSLCKKGFKAVFLTPVRAQVEYYRNILKGTLVEINTTAGFQVHYIADDYYDAILLDEVQKMNVKENENNRETVLLRTIAKATNTVIFLGDELQQLQREASPEEIIRSFAQNHSYEYFHYNLSQNIRYSGRGSGIQWLAHQLQIQDNENYEDWDTDQYSIDIVGSVDELRSVVNKHNQAGDITRILINYRKLTELEWDSNENAYYSIIDARKEYKIPVCTIKSSISRCWLTDTELSQYAVGPNLVQGLELKYAAVILGNDIGYDKNTSRIISNNKQDIDTLKRAYYILLSRGMSGVIIYCQDPNLKHFLEEKIYYAKRRYNWIKQYIVQYNETNEESVAGDELSSLKEEQFGYVPEVTKSISMALTAIKQSLSYVIDNKQLKKIMDIISAELLQIQQTALNDGEIRSVNESLIISRIGESAWNKLGKLSKDCLISAEITYHDLKDYDSLLDFSGVCIQVTKAVEYEITQRYLSKYLAFLQKTYGDQLMQRIPKTLLDRGNPGQLIEPQKFTLGDVRRKCVGLKYDGSIDNKYVYKNFLEYAKKELLINSDNAVKTLKEHMKIIQKIKDDYRNKAAHKESMDVVAAKACLDYIIEVQRKLGIMLDAYKF